MKEMEVKDGKEMLRYEQAGNTPFMLVEKDHEDDDGVDYFCTVGRHRVTEFFSTKEEALEDVEKIDWPLIGAVIEATCSAYLESHLGKANNDEEK